jgi:hypothetical protein
MPPPSTIIAASNHTVATPAGTAAAPMDPSQTAGAGGRRRRARVMRWATAADPALGKTLETCGGGGGTAQDLKKPGHQDALAYMPETALELQRLEILLNAAP